MSNTTTGTGKSVLAVGLVLPPSPAATAMQVAVSSALQKAKEAGYHAQAYAIDPASEKLEENMAAFRDFLATEYSWDAVMVGWGIRGNPEMTELFERIINTVVEVQVEMGRHEEEGKVKVKVPKFVFSLKPDGFVEAVQRVLG